MLKIYITASFSPDLLEKLRSCLDVTVGGWGFTGRKLKPPELAAWAHDADILIVGYEEVTKKVIDSLPKLILVACARGGYDASVDVSALTGKRIPLIYTPGRNSDAVADLAMGLLISSCRKITRTAHLIWSRKWDEVPWDIAGETEYKRYSGPELAGKTMGIIGFGAVGRKVCQRAKGFGMEVVAYDPFLLPEKISHYSVKLLPLEDLLALSDFVVICTKLTPQSTGLIGYEQFRLMKPSSYIVNVARGGVIDEDALIRAVTDKWIAGAGLDVLIEEPVRRDHPLLNSPNVIITPHLGGASDDLIRRQSEMITQDLYAWLKGERPSNLANPSVYKVE